MRDAVDICTIQDSSHSISLFARKVIFRAKIKYYNREGTRVTVNPRAGMSVDISRRVTAAKQ